MTSGSMLKFWHILVLHNLDLLKKKWYVFTDSSMGNHHVSPFGMRSKLIQGLLVTLRDLINPRNFSCMKLFSFGRFWVSSQLLFGAALPTHQFRQGPNQIPCHQRWEKRRNDHFTEAWIGDKHPNLRRSVPTRTTWACHLRCFFKVVPPNHPF